MVDETFIDTGPIKHLPLQSHEQAAAAAASECAGDQGRFWDMHDPLFETLDEWAVANPDPQLSDLAGRLGLAREDSDSCLASRAALERILVDIYEADGVIEQRPSFVILYGGPGRRLEGARSSR